MVDDTYPLPVLIAVPAPIIIKEKNGSSGQKGSHNEVCAAHWGPESTVVTGSNQ
mgnify:CR=1 FL=1|jgi:hypothetical protein